jgi:hypothetical protein
MPPAHTAVPWLVALQEEEEEEEEETARVSLVAIPSLRTCIKSPTTLRSLH